MLKIINNVFIPSLANVIIAQIKETPLRCSEYLNFLPLLRCNYAKTLNPIPSVFA